MHNYKESVSYFFIYKFIKNVFKFLDIISFKSDWLKHAWKGGPSSQLLVYNYVHVHFMTEELQSKPNNRSKTGK